MFLYLTRDYLFVSKPTYTLGRYSAKLKIDAIGNKPLTLFLLFQVGAALPVCFYGEIAALQSNAKLP